MADDPTVPHAPREAPRGRSSLEPLGRLMAALVAWPPLAIASATAIGDLTGCAGYAAACTGAAPLLPWLAQAAILGALLAAPPLARILAGGTLAVLVALVPITGVLVAMGAAYDPGGGPALAILLVLAWLAGVAVAAFVRPVRWPLS
jgi:hypothetical protein